MSQREPETGPKDGETTLTIKSATEMKEPTLEETEKAMIEARERPGLTVDIRSTAELEENTDEAEDYPKLRETAFAGGGEPMRPIDSRHGTPEIGSREGQSILKAQPKSQKSNILLSDIRVGSGLKLPNTSDQKLGSKIDSRTGSKIGSKDAFGLTTLLKSQRSQLVMSDPKIISVTGKSQSKSNTKVGSKESQKSNRSDIQVGSGHNTDAVPKSDKSESYRLKVKSQRSQLKLSDMKDGSGLKEGPPLSSSKSQHNMPDAREMHSILMQGGSKTHSMTSEERFLTASARNSEITDQYHKPTPFSTRWVRGYNSKVPVINLNKQGSTILFYAAVNFGILYNWTTNSMKILEGHKHMVSNIAADANARWLVTADSGPENIITVWDATTCCPQKTLFAPHGAVKLAKVSLSADAKYLLSLAYTDKACLNFWIWSFGLDEPHGRT